MSCTNYKKDLVVFCKSKFLKDYPGADGVKSGYTKQAGYCFVGSATRDGWRLVSAVLKSENSGNDTAALMDYGFDNFQPVDVARVDSDRVNVEVNGGSKGSIEAVPARDLRVVEVALRAVDDFAVLRRIILHGLFGVRRQVSLEVVLQRAGLHDAHDCRQRYALGVD